MSAPPAISAIGAGLGVEFGTHKMLAARAAMSASTKYPYLIYKV
jgi:hypothetical protein